MVYKRKRKIREGYRETKQGFLNKFQSRSDRYFGIGSQRDAEESYKNKTNFLNWSRARDQTSHPDFGV